jgi:rod shape-determining protein MreD
MNSLSLRRFFTFVIIVLLQSFIFDKLPLSTYVRPCIYLLFIVLLPFGYSQVKALLWAFALGLSIDLLTSDVIGINTAATVLAMMVRPYLLKLFSLKIDNDLYTLPSVKTLGLRPFFGYISLLLLLHQTVFFLMDSFALYDILLTIARILLSTLCSILLILALQSLFSGNRKTNL